MELIAAQAESYNPGFSLLNGRRIPDESLKVSAFIELSSYPSFAGDKERAPRVEVFLIVARRIFVLKEPDRSVYLARYKVTRE